MKFAHLPRIAMLFAGVSMIASALVLPGAATSSYARMPMVLTDTPEAPQVPTNTPEPQPQPTTPPRPTGMADPYIVESGPTTCVHPDEPFEFTAIASNKGNVTAVNVQVYQQVPPYFELVSVTASRGTVIITGNSYIVDLGNLDPNEIVTIKIKVKHKGDSPTGDEINVVLIKTTSSGEDPNNNTGFARVMYCAPVLPVTGGAEADNTALPITLTLFGAMLMTASLVQRKRDIA